MTRDKPTQRGQLRTWLERIGIFGPAGVLIIAAFVVAYQFVQPAPPRHIVMATGSKDGIYRYYGGIYRELMAKEGIDVTLVETAGSVENIGLLANAKADVAFVQGGTSTGNGDDALRSLASLYFEPIWIFVRKGEAVARLSDLKGRRVGVDREGSGTSVMARQMLADVGLDRANVQMSPLGGAEAAAALHDRALDAAFFIVSANSPIVQELLAASDIQLLSLDRAPAYRVQHRYLSVLKLPEGAIDLAADLPPADTLLLAPAANLVVREDFHPALAELLLIEARKIHGDGGTFEEVGEFPSRKYLEYPIASAAQRFFDSGPSFLQRYLPFWAANLIDRLKIMLLPLIALAYPLFKVIPPTYDWRMRTRINRWYKQLQAIERGLDSGATRDEMRESLEELIVLEQKVRRLTMPYSYGNPLFSLRVHIAMLRNELQGAIEAGSQPGRKP